MNTDAITIEYGQETLTAEDFINDGFTLEENLCSEQQIAFGACEAAAVEIEVISTAASFVGQRILAKLGDEPLGHYKIVSDERASDGETRTLKGYDALYEVNGRDVADWYSKIDWDTITTLKQLRDSFFAYIGIEQAAAVLPNDSMAVKKTMDTTSCSGATILKAICEINGVFGHIDKNGKFKYVALPDPATSPIYMMYAEEVLDTMTEDYTVPGFDSVLIRTEEGDIGGQYPVAGGDNQYVIQNNFLCYGKSTEELQIIALRASTNICGRPYIPFEAEVDCQNAVALGGRITIPTEPATFTSYVLRRQLVGIDSLTEYFAAQGTAEYSPDANSTRNQAIATERKINKITSTVEGTLAVVEEIKENAATKTMINQTARSIKLSGSSNDKDKVSITLELYDADGEKYEESTGVITMKGLVEFVGDEAWDAETKAKNYSDDSRLLDLQNLDAGKTVINAGCLKNDSIMSNHIIAKNLDIQGGSVNIETDTVDEDKISLNFINEVGAKLTSQVSPLAVAVYNDETKKLSYVSDAGFFVKRYLHGRTDTRFMGYLIGNDNNLWLASMNDTNMRLVSENDIYINASDTLELTSGGAITIQPFDELELKTQVNMRMSADDDIDIASGGTINMSGATGVDISSSDDTIVLRTPSMINMFAEEGVYINGKPVRSSQWTKYGKDIKPGSFVSVPLYNEDTLVVKGRTRSADSWQTLTIPIQDIDSSAQEFCLMNASGGTLLFLTFTVEVDANKDYVKVTNTSTSTDRVIQCVYVK